MKYFEYIDIILKMLGFLFIPIIASWKISAVIKTVFFRLDNLEEDTKELKELFKKHIYNGNGKH